MTGFDRVDKITKETTLTVYAPADPPGWANLTGLNEAIAQAKADLGDNFREQEISVRGMGGYVSLSYRTQEIDGNPLEWRKVKDEVQEAGDQPVKCPCR